LVWHKKWKKVLEWKEPFAKWFIGGQLNASENCLDRHLTGARKHKAALIWESEPGEKKTLTYQQLHREVCKFANVLKRNGVRKGDRVIIYMPMCPEEAIAMLACARIGAIHSVIFGGFSSEAIKDRINDSQAKIVITADGGYRRGAIVPLKKNVDDALTDSDQIERVIVFRRAGNEIQFKEGRDVWWHEEMRQVHSDCPPVSMDAEDPLYVLYTSSSTGKPKGVLHTTGGYLLGVTATMKYVFDLRGDDVFWCSADIGWVTGHS
jgi:acetyl-CoA synthetase